MQLSGAIMNHQTGTLGDGRHFDGIANPLFPLLVDVMTDAPKPVLEFAGTPVLR
jgi:hypothetical protein